MRFTKKEGVTEGWFTRQPCSSTSRSFCGTYSYPGGYNPACAHLL